MKAALLTELNRQLNLVELPDPKEEDGKAVVDLNYAALNHRDLWIKKGMYAKIKLPVVLGSDGCGILDQQEVIINPSIDWGNNERYQSKHYKILGLPDHGTLASKVCVPFDRIYPKPQHLSQVEAAALPLAGLTAYRALVVKCQPDPSDIIFISGVGGGVASMVFQMALALGSQVIVSSGSEAKREKSIASGALAAFDYSDDEMAEKILREYGGVDIVIDGAAGKGSQQFVKMCKPGGRICFYGGTKGNIGPLNPQQIFWKQLSILGSTMGSDKDFQNMLTFVNKYQLRPWIDEVIPLSEVNRAFDKMEFGSQFGKIVIDLHS